VSGRGNRAREVGLPGRAYGLGAGDTARYGDRVRIETHEPRPRAVTVDTREFSDLNLGYAVHLPERTGGERRQGARGA
jgi:hypothetical protein